MIDDCRLKNVPSTFRFQSAIGNSSKMRECPMATILQDLKYGFRMLAKNPGFTAIAVISLGLGIGANTTIFSFVNALLFQQPAVESPSRLVEIFNQNTKRSGIEHNVPLNYPDYVY